MTQADMHRPIRVLLQTTIPATPDDWHIGRFSLLKDHLVSLVSPHGEPLYDVVARDRSGDADDPCYPPSTRPVRLRRAVALRRRHRRRSQ
jgi:hypothetical protein